MWKMQAILRFAVCVMIVLAIMLYITPKSVLTARSDPERLAVF